MNNNDNFNSESEEIIILLDDDDNVVIPEEEFSESVIEDEIEEIEIEEVATQETTVIPAAAVVPETVMSKPQPRRNAVTIEESDEDFEEEDDEDDEDGGIFGGLATKLMLAFGIIIAILLIFVGYRMISVKRGQVEKVDFSQVGVNVADIKVIGGDNISLITQAQGSKLEELLEAVQNYDYDEADEETGITTVDVTLTTILKDLKIKFVNKKNKLIANVPFKVDITFPDGKTKSYSDDDKDGVIYLEDIAGGAYSVSLVDMEGYNQYYDFSAAGSKSVTVKTQLDYKKVDVSNEIKTATEAESKKEDTSVNDTEEESKLKDTVAYVVSDKIKTSDGYVEIDKASKIEDPINKIKASIEKAAAFRFMKLADDETTPGTEPETPENPNPEQNPCTEHKWEYTFVDATNHLAKCGNEGCEEENLEAHTPVAKSTDSTNHELRCTVCKNVIKAEPCDFDTNGKCTANCGNTKKVISVSGTVNILKANTDGTYSFVNGNTDATKNVGEAEVKLNFGEGCSEKDLTSLSYEWTSSDTSVLTIDNKTASKATFKLLKTGKAVLYCNIKYISVTDGTEGTIMCEKKITVLGVKIDTTIENKKVIFVGGDDLAIPLTVTGGETNKVEWDVPSTASFVKVKVSDDTKTATITGLSEGTCEITAKSKDDSSVTKKFTIVVSVHPKNDKTTKLVDKEGNQVYKKDASGKYVEAKYADFYTGEKLYTGGVESYKYTGWWTINGKTYYFDVNGNKVTGDQVILGAKYSFGSDGVLKSGTGLFGIDVSTWNGTIDWSKVAKSGVSYAIIRCGFRGSTEGGLFVDNKFAANIKNATAAGIKVGVYFFTQAINEKEAVEEASMCIGLVENYKLAYPIFIDVEGSGGRADGISKEARTNVIKAFCKTVQGAGYAAGVYANKNWLTTKINATELTGYKIWLAQYASKPTYETTRYDMWQYSAKGSISGISGDVDLNLSYLGY